MFFVWMKHLQCHILHLQHQTLAQCLTNIQGMEQMHQSLGTEADVKLLSGEICRDQWGCQGMAAMPLPCLLFVSYSLYDLSIEEFTQDYSKLLKKKSWQFPCLVPSKLISQSVQAVNSICLLTKQVAMTTKSPTPAVLIPATGPVLGHPMEILQGQAARASGIKV